jgi:hypothetical protein
VSVSDRPYPLSRSRAGGRSIRAKGMPAAGQVLL